MCDVDWTALGTWVSALAICATAAIAWWQLGIFNRNERLRLTQELFESFSKPVHILIPGPPGSRTIVPFDMTPSQAVGQAEGITEDAALLASLNGGTSAPDVGVRASAYFDIVTNFFSPVPHLLQNNLIDRRYFFDQMRLSLKAASLALSAFRFIENYEERLAPIRDTMKLDPGSPT